MQLLIVFLKAPRVGTVKTRLAKRIGDHEACAVYRHLLTTVLRKINGFDRVELRFTPDDARTELGSWLKPGWTSAPQGPGDLGDRLERAFDQAFLRRVHRVVVIGSDCPDIEADDVECGFGQLKHVDGVVGPANDGGYWLIGLRAPQPQIFRNMPWSSDQVLSETLRRADAAQLRFHLLRVLSDVDTEEDWKRCCCHASFSMDKPNELP